MQSEILVHMPIIGDTPVTSTAVKMWDRSRAATARPYGTCRP